MQAIGAVWVTIAMAYLMAGTDRRFIPLATFGSAATVLSILTFLIVVLMSWRNSESPQVD